MTKYVIMEIEAEEFNVYLCLYVYIFSDISTSDMNYYWNEKQYKAVTFKIVPF